MEPRIIKKYPNRRLYDTKDSKHLNLEDIRELISKYEKFEVHDSKTGNDITDQVLLQILTEQQNQSKNSILTRETLCQLIRMVDSPLGAGFSAYFEEALKLYTKQRQFFVEQMQNSFYKLNPFEMFNSMEGNPFGAPDANDKPQDEKPSDAGQNPEKD